MCVPWCDHIMRIQIFLVIIITSQCGAGYFARLQSLVLLPWLVFLTDVTRLDCGIDVAIDVDPIHRLVCAECLHLYVEMTAVQFLQYECLHALGNNDDSRSFQ